MSSRSIINIRGTSGSGKSTLVRTFMERARECQPVEFFGKRGQRPLVYEVCYCPTAVMNHPYPHIYVIGPYTSPCGGCDAITDYKNILPGLLTKYAAKGAVIFEGLLISGGYGSIGRHLAALEKKGSDVTFALLDTPLELCLERIKQRRAARGVFESLNPKNTEQKYKAAHNSQKSIAELYGHNCVMLDHKRPYKSLMSLLGVEVAREPKHA